MKYLCVKIRLGLRSAILIIILMNELSVAQVILNETFTSDGNCPWCQCCAYDNYINNFDCLEKWSSFSNSPNIVNTGHLGSHFDGLEIDGEAVIMYGCGNKDFGEGAFARFNFNFGACYDISLDIASDNFHPSYAFDLVLVAANSLAYDPPDSECCGTDDDVFGESFVEIVRYNLKSGFSSSDWTTKEFRFIPLDDYDYFAMYAYTPAFTPLSIVDNLKIEQTSCSHFIVYDDPVADIPIGETRASSTITVGENVVPGVVETIGNTDLIAGISVSLFPNTLLLPTSIVYIDECEIEKVCSPYGKGGLQAYLDSVLLNRYRDPAEQIKLSLAGEINSKHSGSIIDLNEAKSVFASTLPGLQRIEIFDVSGRLIFSNKNVDQIIDINSLLPGIYFIIEYYQSDRIIRKIFIY